MFKRFTDTELKADTRTKVRVKEKRDRRLLCAQCGAKVTSESERIEVQGLHQHVHTNPHQITYRIGCFRSANGCSYAGPATAEFTWFKGYRWQVALCAACGIHLGWAFRSEADIFHGLILANLKSN